MSPIFFRQFFLQMTWLFQNEHGIISFNRSYKYFIEKENILISFLQEPETLNRYRTFGLYYVTFMFLYFLLCLSGNDQTLQTIVCFMALLGFVSPKFQGFYVSYIVFVTPIVYFSFIVSQYHPFHLILLSTFLKQIP